jgi:hypothetical protein
VVVARSAGVRSVVVWLLVLGPVCECVFVVSFFYTEAFVPLFFFLI